MKVQYFFMLCLALLLGSCQREDISTGDNISDLFYLENQGAHMPVLVEGNINSGVILIFLHGGPGGTGIGFNNDAGMDQYIEPQFAVAYHDQRGAGNSQGSTAGKLTVEQYADDLKKLIFVLRKRYGDTTKIFLMSHSWGGMIAPAFLTDNNNQNMVSGWINMAGSHNYQLNDELTRAYLLSFGKDQIQKNIHTAEWQPIVDFAENNVPNYNYTISKQYNAYGSEVEAYIDDIKNNEGFGSPLGLLTSNRKGLTPLWFISNSGATYLLNLPKDLISVSYSDKLGRITTPVINLYGKYDFTVPKGLGEEIMQKVASKKKKLVIFPHSGHILMDNETELIYREVAAFVRENK